MRIFWDKTFFTSFGAGRDWVGGGQSAYLSLGQGQMKFLESYEMYFGIFFIMKIAKMIQKRQSVRHENHLGTSWEIFMSNLF